jgi:hypothetical protein
VKVHRAAPRKRPLYESPSCWQKNFVHPFQTPYEIIYSSRATNRKRRENEYVEKFPSASMEEASPEDLRALKYEVPIEEDSTK